MSDCLKEIQYSKSILASRASVKEKNAECAQWNVKYIRNLKPMKVTMKKPLGWDEYVSICRDSKSFVTTEQQNAAISKHIRNKPDIRAFGIFLRRVSLFNQAKLDQLTKMNKFIITGDPVKRIYSDKILLFKQSYLGGDVYINACDVGFDI